MMVRVPSCNIDRPIYICRMEIKFKDTRTPLHICRQGLPSFILISNKPIIEQLRKEASRTNWPGGCCRCRQSPCLRSVRPPITTTPHSYSPYLLFLEISLVFTRGITPAWVNHNECFYKKCILMFRAMHGHLANFFAYNSKHHIDTVFDHFTTMLVSLLVVSRCKL